MAQHETGGANRRFWSMCPLTNRAAHSGYRFVEPQPHGDVVAVSDT